jgi:hypothetical protein
MKRVVALAIGVASLTLVSCASVSGRTQLSNTDLEVYGTIVGTVDAGDKALVFNVHRTLTADKRSVCGPEGLSRLGQNHQPAPDPQTIHNYCQLEPITLSAAQAKQIGARRPARAIFIAEPPTNGIALSPIAYGRQETEALVYVVRSSHGELWLLRRGENGWSVVATYELWIA